MKEQHINAQKPRRSGKARISGQERPLDFRAKTLIDRARESGGKTLSLWGCDLAVIPEEVWSLPHLESIDLNGNRLRTIPNKLRDLRSLLRISLIGNPLESLPDVRGLVIDEETYLRFRDGFDPLNISGITLDGHKRLDDEDWSANLKALKNLRELTIGTPTLAIGETHEPLRVPIVHLLDSLGEFDLLERLSLRGVRLPVVPEIVRNLRHLKDVDFSGLGLEQIPEWIGELDLEIFVAVDNKLGNSSVVRPLRTLKRLRTLDLSWNPLGTIPDFFFELAELEYLALRECNVHDVPASILRLTNLRRLDVSGNEIESPPLEIAQRGLDAIRHYWRQREDTGIDYLCEAKLIILGEPGAGKTSLAKKLENPKYKLREREPSTEGIDIIRWEFPAAILTKDANQERLLNRNFRVNIWDFGGQEIYHATHRFFLTRRSVYVLVCDDRKEDTDFGYWLRLVEMLSDASPLLIVQNEKQDRKRDINLSQLRGQFTNLREALATNLDTNRGLEGVVGSIRRELANLPHVGVGLPATWKRVRLALEDDQRNHISLDEYLAVCQQHGFKRREDKLQLSGYLHDLGICLHFQDDAVLKNTVILKPAWGTDAVYRVLDDDRVIEARGKFTRQDLARIWSEDKYAGMQDELLRLMMNFELCYALEDEQAFIAPQLLSSEQPMYPWEATGGLVVRYEYAFLPKGIVTRLIVAMHHLIASENLVWKTGVVLARDNSRAEIIEDYNQRRIRVRVNGPSDRGLLAIIDDQLERLHRSFPRLQYERYLPCSCGECQGKAEPYAFPLRNLQKMAFKGQSIQCYLSAEMVDATRLIEDVLPETLTVPFGVAEAYGRKHVKAESAPSREVFVSYAWTEESSALVDRLQRALEQHGIRLLRDREEVRYKDSIREFMRRIGQGKAVVTVISDKYLKSENCMFEMLEVERTGAFRDRIFPIVLPDANVYKAPGRARYVRHWEEQIRELDEDLKTVRGDSLTNLQADLTLYAEIRRMFDNMAGMLRDMNALTPDRHEGSGFDELVQRIRGQVG